MEKMLAKETERAAAKHFVGIDSLRALAVWAVIVYHLNAELLPGGFTGVDIFFAISGFVITKSLLEREPSSVFRFFTSFYRRRFIRIAPALFFYLICVSLLASYFIPKASLAAGIFETARWAIFGASNIQLVLGNDGYFGERMDFSPFIQTWSLGVEEQFYLIWPIVIVLLAFAIFRSKKLIQRFAIALISLLTVASLVISAEQSNSQQINAFYLLPSRFWELALGGLLYIAIRKQDKLPKLSANLNRAIFLIGAALIAATLVYADLSQFPFWWAIPPVVGTLFLIFSATNGYLGERKGIAKFLTARPIVYFGKISFSLYLWHWGVFVLMRWTIGLTSWWHWVIAIVATVLVSAASYKFIETPVRTGKLFKKMPDWQVIVSGALVALMVFFVVDFSKSEGNRRGRAVVDPAYTNSQLTKEFLSSIEASEIGVGRKFILVGDSHAGHYKYMGNWIKKKTGAEPSRIINYGCPYVNLQGTGKRPQVCPSDEEITQQILARANPGDVIVLSSFSTPRMSGLERPFDKEELISKLNSSANQASRDEALEISKQIVSELISKGLQVVLAAPTPVFVTPADRCQRWFNRINPICSNGFKEDIEYQQQLREPVMKSYNKLVEATGITLWDPFLLLCPDGKYCYSEKNGNYLFIDQHHLTSNGNLLLIESMLDVLKRLWK
jgi:peptidoglycan/LPS O-acetylase OafA/YrhL